MAAIDESCIRGLLAIQWFGRCGEAVAEVDEVEMEVVGSWSDGLTYWNSDRLSDLQGEQRSRLQLHLFRHHRRHHAQWSEMIDLVDERLGSSNLHVALQPLLDHGFNELHIDVAMSHLRLAIMESSYASSGCDVPRFFRTFLHVYSVGRLPCGWSHGEFPQGRSIVY